MFDLVTLYCETGFFCFKSRHEGYLVCLAQFAVYGSCILMYFTMPSGFARANSLTHQSRHEDCLVCLGQKFNLMPYLLDFLLHFLYLLHVQQLLAVLHIAGNLLTIQLHCHFTQVLCDSLFPSFKMTLLHPLAFMPAMTLCNTNLFLKLQISAESPDPLPILSYRATVFEEYTSNKALSELQDWHFPFWHINAIPGSPGGSSML